MGGTTEKTAKDMYLVRAASAHRIGLATGAGWLVLCALFFIVVAFGGSSSGMFAAILIVLALVVPLALIALATELAMAQARQASDIARVAAVLRDIHVTAPEVVVPDDPQVAQNASDLLAVSDRLAELEGWLAERAARIDGIDLAPPQADVEPVPDIGEGVDDAPRTMDLELDTAHIDDDMPLPVNTMTRALQFPTDPDDRAGFDALRAAMADRRGAQLVTAAQDVLTLLSQDGLYMDDLEPDRAHPEMWRRFAQGERGPSMAQLGGIRDDAALETSVGRMRQDTIYRDAVHHFLRLFDHYLAEAEPRATDAQISALTDTRSARAFMLLGRAVGIFNDQA